MTGYFVSLDRHRVSTITNPACTKYTFLRLKAPIQRHTFGVSAFDAAGNESQRQFKQIEGCVE